MPAAGFKNVLHEPAEFAASGVKDRESLYKISGDTVVQRWPAFVDDVRKTKIAIGTTLSESRFLEANNGTVRIGCPDEYHLSSLKRNKEFLAESFQKVTGVRVSIEPVIQPTTPVKENPEPVSSSPTPAAGKPDNGDHTEDHPVIVAIKRELGGELVR